MRAVPENALLLPGLTVELLLREQLVKAELRHQEAQAWDATKMHMRSVFSVEEASKIIFLIPITIPKRRI